MCMKITIQHMVRNFLRNKNSYLLINYYIDNYLRPKLIKFLYKLNIV